MTKYIDADRLRAQIDKIEEEARKVRVSGTDKEAIGADSKVKLCLKLKSLIDSLQQEQPEVDIEKEYTEFVVSDPVYSKLVNDIVGKSIARHFYKLGLKAK